MAIKSGRVGVRPDQVDEYGRVVASDYLVDQLKEVLPPSGELVPLHVNLNGTYTPASGTGYGPVTVSVPLDVDAIASGRPRGAMTLTVTEVAPFAFYHKDITRLTCPNVTIIKEGAFSHCTQLTHISASSVTTLEGDAFSFCNRLTSVAISSLQTMGNRCFLQCVDLTSVTFTNVTSIGANAFEGCSSLSDISMPNLRTIGGTAFKQCSSLTSFSNSLITRLDSSTFRECTKLTSIDIPNVTTIGGYCFTDCSSNDFTSAILPSLTTCSAYSFSGCKMILVFPAMVNMVSNSLSGWKGKEVDFGVGIKTFQSNIFNSFNTSFPFDTLILRNPDRVVTIEANTFNNNTAKFAPNQSGGTVYIPRVLYDHLGDGTSLDYRTSANWTAMLNLNSNNTFAPIEGSYYETHYADGTLINL